MRQSRQRSMEETMPPNEAEKILKRIREGGRRGGSVKSEAKVESGRRNAALARVTKEMYRKFPILREQANAKTGS